MQSFIGTAHLLLILVLKLAPAQITPPPEEGPPRVMSLMDAWRKSQCQPMEQLVDVEQEIPGNVGFIYIPPCVLLQRCSGWCGDESLECHPSLVHNITVEMKRIVSTRYMDSVELTFVEHETCECRVRQKVNKVESSGEPIKKKPRRKNKKTANCCGKCQSCQNNIRHH